MKTTTFTTTNHDTFAGIIDNEDFSTSFPNKKLITKYADANNLKAQLEEKMEKKKFEESYKHMTLEELREMKLVSNTNGRPIKNLTDEKWQKEFELRKIFVDPFLPNVKKMPGKYSTESGFWNEEMFGSYLGITNWQQYCVYINDVLKNIRSGQVDYCYYIYQIETLLKFHRDDLRTRYRDGYWEVWLEGSFLRTRREYYCGR